MMAGVNYVIYDCSSARTTPRVSLYQSLIFEENIFAVITQDRVMDDNLKRQIKNQTLCTCRLFLPGPILDIRSMGAFFGTIFFKKGTPPKQMSFLTISNKKNFFQKSGH